MPVRQPSGEIRYVITHSSLTFSLSGMAYKYRFGIYLHSKGIKAVGVDGLAPGREGIMRGKGP